MRLFGTDTSSTGIESPILRKNHEEKKMKTRTTFILSLTAILTLAAGSAFGKYSGGSGTAGNPYKIATKVDLLALAANTDGLRRLLYPDGGY